MMIAKTARNPVFKSPKSQFIWRRDWGFSAIKHDTETFLRYGICGDCEVACQDGMTKIKDLSKSQKLITRSHGFVTAIGLMHNRFSESGENERGRVGIPEGALGGGLPRQFIVLGGSNEVSRYVTRPKSRRLSIVSFDLKETEGVDVVRNCAAGELCIPIFPYSVQISVAGIYVSCPSIVDMTEKARHS